LAISHKATLSSLRRRFQIVSLFIRRLVKSGVCGFSSLFYFSLSTLYFLRVSKVSIDPWQDRPALASVTRALSGLRMNYKPR
jgi:hypothetical protein